MGLYDDVELSDNVREIAQAQYNGSHVLKNHGWQTKSLGCSMGKVKINDDSIIIDDKIVPSFTGAFSFYSGSYKPDWVEFIAVYIDGKPAALRCTSHN